jgi:hypothetical protein
MTLMTVAGSLPQGLVQLVSEGRFVEALEETRAGGDTLERWQNELHVLHSAGDLEGALRTGLEGVRLYPSDPWLWERAVFVALTLHRTATARAHLSGLSEAVAGLPPEGRGSWRATLGRLEAQVTGQEAGRRAVATALARARWTAGGLASLIALVAAWALFAGRAPDGRSGEGTRLAGASRTGASQ